MSAPACAGCRWWDGGAAQAAAGSPARCCLLPPRATGTGQGAAWPWTLPDQWCGYFERRDEAGPPRRPPISAPVTRGQEKPCGRAS